MVKFGKSKIELYLGNITELELDAIVNAANIYDANKKLIKTIANV